MTTRKALNGKPYAGNPHVRFDEGEVASAATPRRGSLLYRMRKLMKFVMVCAATAPSPSWAATAPDFVTNEALFWLDASALDAVAGTELDSWADVRGGSHPTVTTYKSIKPQVIEIADGALAGKKAVTFFTVGTQCDMKFSADQNIKTAFFVTDIDQSDDAYLLGSQGNKSHFYFARGTGGYGTTGSYQFVHSYLNGTEYWNDGVKVAAPTTTVIPTGYQLVTWSRAGGAVVDCLCNDRNISGRIGGKRLCEVIAFNRVLDDEERSQVEGYLKAKWYGGMSQETATFAMRVNKFGKPQVHFDASEAASFHYEVAGDETGTKVSQWDDLSGNGNNFTPSAAKSGNTSAIRYGTRGDVAGKPVFDSGAAGSGIDLALATRLEDTRTVFMVAELDFSSSTFLLGDVSQYRFHRGRGGEWMWTEPKVSYGDYAIYGTIWQNGKKVVAPAIECPEPPGGLTVFAVTATKNLEWNKLGQDRSSNNWNGGKRVAELVTFSAQFTEEQCAAVTELLKAKWKPSDAYVDEVVSRAAVHVDASSPDNFNYTDGAITGWKNAGTGADLVKPTRLYKAGIPCNPGTYGFTNGVPAFLMGGCGSNIDMYFTRLTNIYSVFWTMDIERDAPVFFLGDGLNEINTSAPTYDFHRGYLSGMVGCYGTSDHSADGYRKGPIYCDDALVRDACAERPPRGTHVYDISSYRSLTACSLGADRSSVDGNVARNGGRAISELLIFTNPVSGLTREAIRKRIEAKWTRKCGWAGAGDAEWGTGKYRVFDSDAVVPADGAAAAGVGFTASATLSGGTLTLGDGGFFTSERVAATVSALVAGKLGAYGLGTVNIATAPSTVDAISVGYGSTLVIAAGDTAIAGGLSIQENGKLVLDVSALPAKQHAAISFASCVLPAGGTLYDYVSLAGNTQGHVLTIGADGASIHVNDPGVAMSAEWNGGANDSATVAANWRCWNFNGVELPGALPCFRTTNVVLNGDCDLRTWGTPVFADGVRIDLNGRALRVASLADDDFANAVITNSNAGAVAELRVDVAEGTRMINTSASILGGVKLVKEGLGTYVAAKNRQGYTGGTTILEGVLEKGESKKDFLMENLCDARNYQLGAVGSTITVTTNGANRGVFDIKGMFAQNTGCAEYALVMDGGLVQNTGNDVQQRYGQFFDVRLTADSEFSVASDWGMFSSELARATAIDLGGHTLKIAIANKNFHVVNSELKNGCIDVTSGGYFQTGVNGYPNSCLENVATNVDFRIASALKIYAPLSVRDYEPMFGYNYNDGTGVFSVHGTFKPAAHNYFYGVTLMDGSAIDLSQRTSALPLTSSFTKGKKTIDFAANAKVTVDLSGRADVSALAKSGDYVVTWTEATAPGADVTFRLDAETAAKYTLKADATGLRLGRGGFMLIVR